MSKKILSLILALLMLLQPAASVELLPSSYEADGSQSLSQEVVSSEERPPLTYIHSDISTEPYRTDTESGGFLKSAPLPSSYSLLDENRTTGIKNQGEYGTCWAFASLASLESTYLTAHDQALDLSELHLAYYIFHNYMVPDKLGLITEDGTITTKNKKVEGNTFLDVGGNNYTASFALASGIGLVSETSAPYTGASSCVNNPSNFENNSPSCYESDFYPTEINWFSPQDRDAIKRAIMENGSVAASMYFNDYYMNLGTYAYYSRNQIYSNHAITIIGWDDNYATSNFKKSYYPSQPGAWLIQNSWGEDFANDGYFWLSYYDDSILNTLPAQYFVAPIEDINVYQYDGSINVHEFSQPSYSADIGNIYQTSSYEVLDKVGFFTGEAGTQYTVKVYTRKNQMVDPEDGTLVSAATVSGICEYAGFHTVALSEIVPLEPGTFFGISIHLYNAPKKVHVVVDYSEAQAINMVEYINTTEEYHSFYKTGTAAWTDLHNFEVTARIKAYTSNGSCIVNTSGELISYTGSAPSLEIPEGVITIKANVFDGHSELTSLTLPNTLKTIESGAFSGCSGLTSLTIPASVTSISDSAIPSGISLSVSCGSYGQTFAQTHSYTYTVSGHPYGEPVYIWTDTNLYVTASRTCPTCSAVEEETVQAGSTVTKQPDCTHSGIHHYTSNAFSNPAFAVQEKDVVVSALGHQYDYDNIQWEWNGVTAATATCICARDSGHTVSYIATITSTNVKDATLEESGLIKYTASAYINFVTHTDIVFSISRALGTKIYLANPSSVPYSDLYSNGRVYINGQVYDVHSDTNVIPLQLDTENAILTAYTSNDSSESDPHRLYPAELRVFSLQQNWDGSCTATPLTEFTDILQYEGTSIRMTGNKGIRAITSIPTVKKNNLITNGIYGYKVVEYGTIMGWASGLGPGEEPTLQLVASGTCAKGRAYSKSDNINNVYKEANGLTLYTNTLVGNYTDAQCGSDFAMRSYMILRPVSATDSADDVVIYGGTLYRSISYVAYQNRNTYAAGSDAYEYIWSLIHAGYGTVYDAEYQGGESK